MKMRSPIGIGIGAAIVAASVALPAFAADVYPTKAIHIINPSAAGGGLDLTNRLIAQKMSDYLKVPVIVDNRPGANTATGTRQAKEVAPDGYTILAQANGFLTLPEVMNDPGFDPIKDFVSIGTMTKSGYQMEVYSGEPDMTVGDFVKRAKAAPGQISYASGGVGTPQDLAAQAFFHSAGIKLTMVPYKGNGPAVIDVAGGRVPMLFDVYMGSSAYVNNGKLRPLAVTYEKRSPALPNVPTFKELGYDATFTLWLGLLAPKGTPPEIVKKLSEALHYATSDKELSARFLSEGSIPGNDTPEECDKFLAEDQQRLISIVKIAGIPKQ